MTYSKRKTGVITMSAEQSRAAAAGTAEGHAAGLEFVPCDLCGSDKCHTEYQFRDRLRGVPGASLRAYANGRVSKNKNTGTLFLEMAKASRGLPFRILVCLLFRSIDLAHPGRGECLRAELKAR